VPVLPGIERDNKFGFDSPDLIFQLPIAAQICMPGQVIASCDIGAGLVSDCVQQELAILGFSCITGVEQNVSGITEVGRPLAGRVFELIDVAGS